MVVVVVVVATYGRFCGFTVSVTLFGVGVLYVQGFLDSRIESQH